MLKIQYRHKIQNTQVFCFRKRVHFEFGFFQLKGL